MYGDLTHMQKWNALIVTETLNLQKHRLVYSYSTESDWLVLRAYILKFVVSWAKEHYI